MDEQPSVLVLHQGAQPTSQVLTELAAQVPIQFSDEEHLAEHLPGTDVLYLHHFLSRALPDAWHAAGSVQWVHVAAAGVDPLLFEDLITSNVQVTNSRGVFDHAIAEYVLGHIIAEAKDLRSCWADQEQRRWRHRETKRVAGSRALVVGTGTIGRAVARLLRAVGMQVTGSGRRDIADDPDFGTVTADLHGALRRADWVVAVAPLTDATRGMFNTAAFAAMTSGARLINVGRGELVNTNDLVQALTNGEIAGAVLDVTHPEPLPTEHPLWTLPGVSVTAHQSGDVHGWRDELDQLFADNLARWRGDRELRNIVDLQLGYVPSNPVPANPVPLNPAPPRSR